MYLTLTIFFFNNFRLTGFLNLFIDVSIYILFHVIFLQEYRINQLTEEVTRLRNFEFDSFRKDQLIQQLQQQISDLQVS